MLRITSLAAAAALLGYAGLALAHLELDASEDDEVQILANNLPVARGTVVVSGNRIAVEIKEMLPRAADRR